MNELILSIPTWLLPAILFALSVLTVALILEKGFLLYIRLRREPFADVLAAGAAERDAGRAPHDVLEREGRDFAADLKRRLPALGTISTVAPLVGLLGTVTGMIKSFHAFEAQSAGAVTRPLLLGGIDEALITTCFGLIVAIPALIAYNTYAARVNTLLDELDFAVERFLKAGEEP